MAVTILEALQNAKVNLNNVKYLGAVALALAEAQLENAIILLEKGYTIDTLVEPLIDKYGEVNLVPENKN